MTWHPEILSKRQARVLARIGSELTAGEFYLAGGTAVALQLGHRRSVDLDWFTTGPLEQPLAVAQQLRETGIPFVTEQVAPGTLHGRVSGVRVSLLEYRYPLLRPPLRWPAGRTAIASLTDLAAMKLAGAAQRGAKKDLIDVYALARKFAPVQRMVRWYQEKYQLEDTAHLLYSLAYFDDADRERSPKLLWDVDWPAIKRALRDWVQEITNRRGTPGD